MRSFSSVQEAYLSSLQYLLENGRNVPSVKDTTSVGSRFGNSKRDFTEVTGYGFSIKNPRDRIISLDSRNVSFGFCIANFIWTLSGENTVDSITHYNRNGRVFANNDLYYEAAFGDRIFGKHQLWKYTKDLLENDESSRRAFMPLFIPSDLKERPKDTPCASSIQLQIRDQSLDLLLHMRSQSAMMVFPYDIFLFTMLHEWFSVLLRKRLGKFHYYCNSFHFYNDERERVLNILGETERSSSIPMTKMDGASKQVLDHLLDEEKRIRTLQSAYRFEESMDLSNYWKDLLKVLARKSSIENGYEEVRYEYKDNFLYNKLHI